MCCRLRARSIWLLFNYDTLLSYINKPVTFHLNVLLILNFLAHPVAQLISKGYYLFSDIGCYLHRDVWIRLSHPCIMDHHLKTFARFRSLR